MEPIRGDSQLRGLLQIWNGPLHVFPGRSRCWLYDDMVSRSKQGQSLSLSLVPAHHESAAAMRCQSPQRHCHPPSLDSPEAAAVAGDEHYYGHSKDLSHGAHGAAYRTGPELVGQALEDPRRSEGGGPKIARGNRAVLSSAQHRVKPAQNSRIILRQPLSPRLHGVTDKQEAPPAVRSARRRSARESVWQSIAVPWTSPPPDLVDGPMTGDDRGILEGYLAWQRSTLLNVCAGLNAEQLAERAMPPSTLSLLGLVRHLAKVERIWLRQRAAGQEVASLYGGPGNDTDFQEIDAARAEHEVELLRQEWRLADEAVASVPFTHEVDAEGYAMSLRIIYVHVIGEYARHNGHADLLREALDGVTGR